MYSCMLRGVNRFVRIDSVSQNQMPARDQAQRSVGHNMQRWMERRKRCGRLQVGVDFRIWGSGFRGSIQCNPAPPNQKMSCPLVYLPLHACVLIRFSVSQTDIRFPNVELATAGSVCVYRSMGMPGGKSISNFGSKFKKQAPPEYKTWITDVKCKGDESWVGSCKHELWGQHECTHNQVSNLVSSYIDPFGCSCAHSGCLVGLVNHDSTKTPSTHPN